MERKLPPEELARRLLNTIQSISGESSIEEFVDISDADGGVEGVSTKRVRKAQDAAARMLRGGRPTDEGIYHVEAIVHRKHRPSHRVRNNKFDPFPGDFRYLSQDQRIRKRIEGAFPSIGRIDITDMGRYEGTGFVVGKNLVMTNRHVAQAFTEGVGRCRVRLQPLGSEIDFAEKAKSDKKDGYELIEPVMVHPYWDMALFRADLPDIGSLTLSTTPYRELLRDNQVIVAIGYPAHDSRNGLKAQKDIFGDEYEVKRIAPGRITRKKRSISSKWLRDPVAALAHDASTLGGNSGSAVINVSDGTVAALHFAGRYLLENYGVPAHELARDPRIVDAGVVFRGAMPSSNHDLDPYWSEHEESGAGDSSYVFTSPSRHLPRKRSTTMKRSGNSITVEVPLQITITLGDSDSGEVDNYDLSPDDQGDSYDASDIPDGTDDFEVGESTGSGYDADFLSEPVPVPGLSSRIEKDTFKLNGVELINYTHFSVCQSKSRRLPRFVAWNIDGGDHKKLSRKGIKFILDRRIPQKYQAGNELYVSNKYDRGHVARRADLNWGPMSEAKDANRDSFFFTNMTPQHEKFNQSAQGGLWGKLENAIFDDADVEGLRVSVIAGPIFKASDKVYRNVQIPEDFWKLIAFYDEQDDEFKVAAYIISQSDLVFTERRRSLDEFHLYQVSLSKLAKETKLDFDELMEFDTFDSTRESSDGSGMREIHSEDDLFEE